MSFNVLTNKPVTIRGYGLATRRKALFGKESPTLVQGSELTFTGIGSHYEFSLNGHALPGVTTTDVDMPNIHIKDSASARVFCPEKGLALFHSDFERCPLCGDIL